MICAGFGGQGIMLLGKVLANCGMKQGYNVTWLPSYGAEVRGGTAHAQVKISRGEIANPMISRSDCVIIMNKPSLGKFTSRLAEGGLAIINTSLVDEVPDMPGRDVIAAPLTEEAIKIGNVRVANMIACGIFAGREKIISEDTLKKVIKEMAKGREELISPNLKALQAGLNIARKAEK